LGMEQVKALADLSMITLLGFFDALDINRQLSSCLPRQCRTRCSCSLASRRADGRRTAGQLERFEKTRVRHF
jgi:hypothetical protein